MYIHIPLQTIVFSAKLITGVHPVIAEPFRFDQYHCGGTPVCMYVCVCVCMYVCMHICVYACVFAYLHAHVCALVYFMYA